MGVGGGVSGVLDTYSLRCLIDLEADSAAAPLPNWKCLGVCVLAHHPPPPQSHPRTMMDECKNIIAQLLFLALEQTSRHNVYFRAPLWDQVEAAFCRTLPDIV